MMYMSFKKWSLIISTIMRGSPSSKFNNSEKGEWKVSHLVYILQIRKWRSQPKSHSSNYTAGFQLCSLRAPTGVPEVGSGEKDGGPDPHGTTVGNWAPEDSVKDFIWKRDRDA